MPAHIPNNVFVIHVYFDPGTMDIDINMVPVSGFPSLPNPRGTCDKSDAAVYRTHISDSKYQDRIPRFVQLPIRNP
jgi:hypothetical protein